LQVKVLVIGFSRLPEFPKDGEPTVGKPSNGPRSRVTPVTGLGKVGNRPRRLVERRLGPLLNNRPKVVVTGLSKTNRPALTALFGDRSRASKSLQSAGRRKTLPVITQFTQQGGCQNRTHPRQGVIYRCIGMLCVKRLHRLFGLFDELTSPGQSPGQQQHFRLNRFYNGWQSLG
jgi:hypothetical protein